MNSRLGTPRKKSVSTRQTSCSGLMSLVRPSIRARPSTSTMAPAVSATLTVPSKPASKNFQVVRCVKKYQ